MITDKDFRTAVTEIAVQAREASRAWARLRSRLDDGPVDERPERLRVMREAYYIMCLMRHRVLSVVGALAGTLPLQEWTEEELERIPELLEAAGRRQHER